MQTSLSKYEEEQVRRLLADGISPNKVARMLGVDPKPVHRIAEAVTGGK